MVAVGGLDNAAVAHSAAVGKAPVVELRDHLAGVDVLIEAAGGLGAGILGILGGQVGKALLGGLSGLPLVVNPLRLGLGLRPALVALGVLGLDEDVADVDHVLVDLLDAVVALNGLGIGVVIVGELLVGERQRIGQGVGIAGGNLVDAQVFPVRLQRGGRAEEVVEIVLRVGITILDGDAVEIFLQGVHTGLDALVELIAVGHGLVIEGGHLLEGLEGGVQEELLPGGGAVHVQLLVQRLGGVHKVHEIGAVGAVEGVILLVVVVEEIPVGELQAAGGGDHLLHGQIHLLLGEGDGLAVGVVIGVGLRAVVPGHVVGRIGAVAVGVGVQERVGLSLGVGHRQGGVGEGAAGGGGVLGIGGGIGGIRDFPGGVRRGLNAAPVPGTLAQHHSHGRHGHQAQGEEGAHALFALGRVGGLGFVGCRGSGLGGGIGFGGGRGLGHRLRCVRGIVRAALGADLHLVVQLSAALFAMFHGVTRFLFLHRSGRLVHKVPPAASGAPCRSSHRRCSGRRW